MKASRLPRALATAIAGIALAAAVLLGLFTWAGLDAAPRGLADLGSDAGRIRISDRHGVALNATYANDWNLYDRVVYHEIPPLLRDAFVVAEDKRFFEHGGADWRARLHALWQNIRAGQAVRGASTITEQVVRLLHPRPRSLWSRWLEGWEAARLERRYSKLDILEFYLNQVPYAARRRGIAQAARYYFDRDLATLHPSEMLALAVLVRAPSRLDLFSGRRDDLRAAMRRLAANMQRQGKLDADETARIDSAQFALKRPTLPVDAAHFLRFAQAQGRPIGRHLQTTLDGALQARLQSLLDQRLETLAPARVANAALLVADHRSGEILAWVIGGAGDPAIPGSRIDAVLSPRQPGSALKPFLYGLALERGWTAATLIDDAPLRERVGTGLHSYRNYSHIFHGPVTLRNALGNSLNIPALRTIQFTGVDDYLALLQRLGFASLGQRPAHYGDGLALGNGEVTLLELVQAYAALAHRGVFRRFAARPQDVGTQALTRVFSAEVASLIGHVLSDPDARRLEFGGGSLLNFPLQTAIKTGTSNDYRDSWAVGYNDRYAAGVWMGNLDRSATAGVTGSSGPALLLRSAFDTLNRHRQTAPLWLSTRLQRHVVCDDGGMLYQGAAPCPRRHEYFVQGTQPSTRSPPPALQHKTGQIRLRQPTAGLHMAYDPRLPAERQAFEFVLQGVRAGDRVEWRIDGAPPAGRPDGARYLWPLSRGTHAVSATVWRQDQPIAVIDETRFYVH